MSSPLLSRSRSLYWLLPFFVSVVVNGEELVYKKVIAFGDVVEGKDEDGDSIGINVTKVELLNWVGSRLGVDVGGGGIWDGSTFQLVVAKDWAFPNFSPTSPLFGDPPVKPVLNDFRPIRLLSNGQMAFWPTVDDKSTGLGCDQTIRLNTDKAKRDYPTHPRRISFVDPLTNKRLVFPTNHFDLPAPAVADIHKSRWQIELFFKWIKQNLRIKAFHGTSENAVRTQIRIAICVYLKVACLNKVHGINESMGRILQVLSVNVFQKEPIHQILGNYDTGDTENDLSNQLIFNGF